jgi:TRAP transporter TAXI family solute receptor
MQRLGRWGLLKLVAAIICIAGLSWFALDYFIPAPPSKFTMVTSFPGGHYVDLGNRYREILARSHIDLELRSTEGAVENLKLLNDPKSGIQVGIMQGGIATGKQAPDLLSLGRIDYQIFWLFYPETEKFDDVTQFKGKRIAQGPPGSGTRAVTEKILNVSGVNSENTTLLNIPVQDAVNALNDGRIDALFITFAEDSPILLSLLKNPHVRTLSFTDAEALTRIFPFLVRLVLPRGTIDYARKIPAADVTLIATTNVILVRKEIHPALIDLLAQTILEAHSAPGLFQKVGDFPTQTDPEFPVSQEARDFYKNGPSFLNRYLPFWMTNYVQRIIAVLVTVIAVVFPIFNYAPRLFLWSVHERMSKLYRRLRAIEKKLQAELHVPQLAALQDELENIDRAASILSVPARYSALLFSLKDHINLIRTRLAARLIEMRSHVTKVDQDVNA